MVGGWLVGRCCNRGGLFVLHPIFRQSFSPSLPLSLCTLLTLKASCLCACVLLLLKEYVCVCVCVCIHVYMCVCTLTSETSDFQFLTYPG